MCMGVELTEQEDLDLALKASMDIVLEDILLIPRLGSRVFFLMIFQVISSNLELFHILLSEFIWCLRSYVFFYKKSSLG